MKIRKGDRVQVLSGKHRGKTGEVDPRDPREAQGRSWPGSTSPSATTRPTRATMQGGIIDKDMPLPVAAVAIICSKDGPTRVRYEMANGRHEDAGLREVRGPTL